MLLRDCDQKVFRVHYTYDKIHRTPTYGGMDSEYSHTESGARDNCLVIAPSSTLARAVFEHARGHTCKVSSIETIGDVSFIIG